MENKNLEELLHEAESALEQASEEQMRPAEDIVPISICHHSRSSIRMYLMSYLLKKGIKPDGNSSIKDLLVQCAALDKRFANLDVSEIECRTSKASVNDEYCLSLDKVTSCFEVANHVKKLVYEM
jgi:HEPN domain-containing protein